MANYTYLSVNDDGKSLIFGEVCFIYLIGNKYAKNYTTLFNPLLLGSNPRLNLAAIHSPFLNPGRLHNSNHNCQDKHLRKLLFRP